MIDIVLNAIILGTFGLLCYFLGIFVANKEQKQQIHKDPVLDSLDEQDHF